MAHRSPKEQKAHDKGVVAEARELDDGWNVMADIEDHKWSTPSKINGRIPDVSATKNNMKQVVEIETDEDDDKSQHEDFHEWAEKRNTRREFYWRVVDENGERGRKRKSP